MSLGILNLSFLLYLFSGSLFRLHPEFCGMTPVILIVSLLSDISYASGTYLALDLESVISLRSPLVSFSGKWYLKTIMGELEMLFASRLTPGLFTG